MGRRPVRIAEGWRGVPGLIERRSIGDRGSAVRMSAFRKAPGRF